MEPWKDLAAKYLEIIKARAPRFIEKNAEVATYVVERTERMAKLSVELAGTTEGTPEQAKVIEHLELVNGTIEDDLVGLAVGAAMEQKHDFELALKTLGDAIVSAIPELVKLIKT